MPGRSSGPYNALEVTDLGSCIDKFCSAHLSMAVRLRPGATKGLSAAQVFALRSRFGGLLPLSLPHTVHDHKQPTRFLWRALQQARTVESDRVVPENFRLLSSEMGCAENQGRT